MTYNTKQLEELNQTLNKMVSVNVQTEKMDTGTKYVLAKLFNKLLLEARVEELEMIYQDFRNLPDKQIIKINNRLNNLKNELWSEMQ